MDVMASCSVSKFSNSKWELLDWDPSISFLFHYSRKGSLSIYDTTLTSVASLSLEGASESKMEGYNEGLHFFKTVDTANCACSLSFDYPEGQVTVDVFILTYRGILHNIRFEMLTFEIRKVYSPNLTQYYKNGGVFVYCFFFYSQDIRHRVILSCDRFFVIERYPKERSSPVASIR